MIKKTILLLCFILISLPVCASESVSPVSPDKKEVPINPAEDDLQYVSLADEQEEKNSQDTFLEKEKNKCCIVL